jgi:hypothetical protein
MIRFRADRTEEDFRIGDGLSDLVGDGDRPWTVPSASTALMPTEKRTRFILFPPRILVSKIHLPARRQESK